MQNENHLTVAARGAGIRRRLVDFSAVSVVQDALTPSAAPEPSPHPILTSFFLLDFAYKDSHSGVTRGGESEHVENEELVVAITQLVMRVVTNAGKKVKHSSFMP